MARDIWIWPRISQVTICHTHRYRGLGLQNSMLQLLLAIVHIAYQLLSMLYYSNEGLSYWVAIGWACFLETEDTLKYR